MGIRLTLGAERADILRLVVGEGLSLTVIGVAIGAAGSLFATRLLQSLLFEIRPSDPLTFVLSAVVLIIVAGLASFIPARRAAQVDPLVSMRAE
jgi:putative ABC transport system permease protein